MFKNLDQDALLESGGVVSNFPFLENLDRSFVERKDLDERLVAISNELANEEVDLVNAIDGKLPSLDSAVVINTPLADTDRI